MSAELSAKTEAKSPDRTPPVPDKSKRIKLIAAGAVILIVIFVGLAMSTKSYSDANIVEISGRIEAPETYITAGVSTKVQTVNVREGDHVQRGQLLLTLDSRALKVKLQATGSQEALARQAQGMAGHQVAAAHSHVAAAQKKSKGFFAKIFASKKKKAEVTAQLTQEMKTAQMQLFQAQAAVVKAQAVKGAVAAKQSFFTLTSPLDGICVTRSIEPGEVVTAGQILLSIIDPDAVYMKGFIAEGSLSQVKLGQQVEIMLDKASHPLIGHITAIDTTPSFTPQNIYFKDDRVKQVFGIKIVIDKPDGSAKPGMPADARIDLRLDKNLRLNKDLRQDK